MGRTLLLIWALLLSPAVVAKPAWLFNLHQDGNKFLYGVAKNISASHLPPIHFAKVNAVKNWALSEGIAEPEINGSLANSDSFELAGQSVYFIDQYKDKSGTYVLVSNQQQIPNKDKSDLPFCNISECNPEWLCRQTEDKISVLSATAVTGHPNDVITQILENAQQLASLIQRSHVQGQIDTLHINTDYVKTANVQERYKITELNNASHSVTLGGMCGYGGGIIAFTSFERSKQIPRHNWLESPNYNSITGVVGLAEGFTSTGRLSDLINVAARKGLFELAKAKNIKLVNQLEFEHNSNGYFSLTRKSGQTTESVVSAFIADMKMELNDDFQPRVMLWLLENKGEL